MSETKDYGLRVFPQETMDKIAEEFYSYFKRKNGSGLSYEDAKMYIDFYTGPTPQPTGVTGTDYSEPPVTGGGGTRPTRAEIDTMLSKYAPSELKHEWDGVFDDVLEFYDGHPWAKKLIYMTFRDREKVLDICKEIAPITYKLEDKDFDKNKYSRNKNTILTQAGLFAYHVGLIDMVSYQRIKP